MLFKKNILEYTCGYKKKKRKFEGMNISRAWMSASSWLHLNVCESPETFASSSASEIHDSRVFM